MGLPFQLCSLLHHFPHKFHSSWISYSSSKWRWLCSLNGHVDPPIMLIAEPRLGIIIWAHHPIFFGHLSFWYMFLGPHQTTYHSSLRWPSKKSNQITLCTLCLTITSYEYCSSPSYGHQASIMILVIDAMSLGIGVVNTQPMKSW